MEIIWKLLFFYIWNGCRKESSNNQTFLSKTHICIIFVLSYLPEDNSTVILYFSRPKLFVLPHQHFWGIATKWNYPQLANLNPIYPLSNVSVQVFLCELRHLDSEQSSSQCKLCTAKCSAGVPRCRIKWDKKIRKDCKAKYVQELLGKCSPRGSSPAIA